MDPAAPDPAVAPAPIPIDWETPFVLIVRHPRGVGTLVVGALLLLLSWLILPALVLIGFGIHLGRNIAHRSYDLPHFHLGLAMDGLRAVVVGFVYLLPMFLMFVLAAALGGSGNTASLTTLPLIFVLYALMIGYALLMFVPFGWTVVTSLKTLPDSEQLTLIPSPITTDAWTYVFDKLQPSVIRMFFNSFLIAIAVTLTNVALGSLAGYAFAAQFQPDAPPQRRVVLALHERIPATKVALVELDRPAEAGLQRVDLLAQLMAIERHGSFETECVAGAEAARLGATAQ